MEQFIHIQYFLIMQIALDLRSTESQASYNLQAPVIPGHLFAFL